MQVQEVLFLIFGKIAQKIKSMLGKIAYIQTFSQRLYLGSTEQQQNSTPQEKEKKEHEKTN